MLSSCPAPSPQLPSIVRSRSELTSAPLTTGWKVLLSGLGRKLQSQYSEPTASALGHAAVDHPHFHLFLLRQDPPSAYICLWAASREV